MILGRSGKITLLAFVLFFCGGIAMAKAAVKYTVEPGEFHNRLLLEWDADPNYADIKMDDPIYADEPQDPDAVNIKTPRRVVIERNSADPFD